MRDCFALLGNHLGVWWEGDDAPPAPLRLHLPLQETSIRFHPFLGSTPGRFIPLLWNFVHMFIALGSLGFNPQIYIYSALDTCVCPLSPKVQIHFWTFPTGLWLRKQVWNTYFRSFTRDSAHFDAFKVSTWRSIDIFWLNLSPSLPPFLFHFRARSGLFLGRLYV